MSPCSSVLSPCWLIAVTISYVFIVDRAFKFCYVQTLVLKNFDVVVLLFPTTAVRGSCIFAVDCEALGFKVGVPVGCLVRSFSGVCSICAGSTRSAVIVSVTVILNWHFSGPIIILYSERRLNKIFKCFLWVFGRGLLLTSHPNIQIQNLVCA